VIRRFAAVLLVALPLLAQLPKGTLWQDPGDIAKLDFSNTAGAAVGVPKAPFTFLREDTSGTQPKLFVRDASGATWNVKFGNEVRVESFCWRVVRACGYFVEPSFFVQSGQFQNMQQLKRPTPSVDAAGRFTDARFQYRDANLTFLDKNWRWDRPPFGGTKELSGLKLLIMLVGNWDNKDGSVGAAAGPNTAIFRLQRPKAAPRYFYAFTDWGSGLGGRAPQRSDWRCSDFTSQPPLVKGRGPNGTVLFNYDGVLSKGFDRGIPRAHVAWLMEYLGRVSDAQLTAGLKAAGGSDADVACYAKALRARIEEMRAAAR